MFFLTRKNTITNNFESWFRNVVNFKKVFSYHQFVLPAFQKDLALIQCQTQAPTCLVLPSDFFPFDIPSISWRTFDIFLTDYEMIWGRQCILSSPSHIDEGDPKGIHPFQVVQVLLLYFHQRLHLRSFCTKVDLSYCNKGAPKCANYLSYSSVQNFVTFGQTQRSAETAGEWWRCIGWQVNWRKPEWR